MIVAYSGLVRATQLCTFGGLRRPQGSVFSIDAVLWSDDPFEPVELVAIVSIQPLHKIYRVIEWPRQLATTRTHSGDGLRASPVVTPEPVKRIPASVELVPYTGPVQALTLCHVAGERRPQGSVFHVDVPALWTDDPFMPVTQTYRPLAGILREPDHTALDLPHVDAALRQHVGDGLLP